MHYTIQPCVLRFKQPATTSRGTYLDRKIWYIHLHEGNFHGLGECAPLYDLSCDYCEDMYGQIDKACRSLVDLGRIDYDAWGDYPSILFALETALPKAPALIFSTKSDFAFEHIRAGSRLLSRSTALT